MFIRWVVRGHKNSDVADVTFHDAYLVESYRDDNGQPRQRTIAYLGNIRQIGQDFPNIERELFTLRAEIIINSLRDLSDEDRQDVMRQLQEKVPPLAADDVLIAFQANLDWYFRWWEENGGAPSEAQIMEMIRQAARSAGDINLD